MKYTRSNFQRNFNNAIGSKDAPAIKDIILNELSDLIILRPFEIVEVLEASGIKMGKNPTETQIINKLADNLPVNRNLQIRIAKMIYAKDKKEGLSFTGKGSKPSWFNANAEGKGKEFFNKLGDALGKIFGAVSTVGSKLGTDEGTQPPPQTSDALAREREETKRKLIEMMMLKRGGKKTNVGAWVMGGVLVAGLTILVVALVRKNKKNK